MNTPESWEIPGGGNGEWDIHNVFTPSSFCRDSGIKISETQRKTQIKKQDLIVQMWSELDFKIYD